MKSLRRNRGKDVTLFEFLCLILLYTLLWPLGIYFLFRRRVLHEIVAGYRESGASTPSSL